jgi:nucleoside-diphosphate-sugar epimerase
MATRRTFLGLAVSVLASPAYADQRIVVTGHLGNIGQRIADKLGTPFVGIDKKNGRLQDLSYRDGDSEWPGMLNGARAVVHLAATGDWLADRDDIYRNNIVATWNLLQECIARGVPRFVFASSTWADWQRYGNPKGSWTPYARSKQQNENLLKALALTGFLDLAVLRIGAAPPDNELLNDDWLKSVRNTTPELIQEFRNALLDERRGYTLTELAPPRQRLHIPPDSY